MVGEQCFEHWVLVLCDQLWWLGPPLAIDIIRSASAGRSWRRRSTIKVPWIGGQGWCDGEGYQEAEKAVCSLGKPIALEHE